MDMITEERTVRVLVMGEISLMKGCFYTAAKLANKPTLRTVDIRLIRQAMATLADRGLVEQGVGYGGADTIGVR